MISMQRGTLVHQLRDFHAKYGDMVRVGPNDLSRTDPATTGDIYGHRIAVVASHNWPPKTSEGLFNVGLKGSHTASSKADVRAAEPSLARSLPFAR